MSILFRYTALSTTLILLLTSATAHAAIEFSSGFNFRETRYNQPLHFKSNPDVIVIGGTIRDTDTGQAPDGAIVKAINNNTGAIIDLNPGSNGSFSRSISYSAGLASGSWEVVVESNAGPADGFILPSFGTGPGTGPIPDVVSNLSVDQSGAQPVMNWNVPADLGALNDGNIDRQRIRLQDSNGSTLVDQRLPSPASLDDTSYTLPAPTHDGLFYAQVLVEGLGEPFIRGRTWEPYLVDGVGTGGDAIEATSLSQVRDNRGLNSVNFGAGDIVFIDAQIDTSQTDPFTTFVHANQGADVLAMSRAGDRPSEFSGSFNFDATKTGPWDVTLHNGGHELTLTTGALGSAPTPDLVRNVTITPNGTTPTLNWVLPDNSLSQFDRVRIGLFDDVTNARIPLGSTGGLFNTLAPDATSFTFDSGILDENGKYVARVILDKTIESTTTPEGVPSSVRTRSLSFLNFTPAIPGVDPVFLPTVDASGVFHFDIDVGELEIVRLDPFVAIGYDYAIGAGNPNFASVELPMIAGDDEFILEFEDALGVLQTLTLLAGDTFEFRHPTTNALLGVDRFAVRGIDPAAGLDPNDVTAFVTTVQFVSAGAFTGTMTPVSIFVATTVSEPATHLLLAFGLLAGAVLRRKQRVA